uniref:Golgi resident protein GCP60 n=1 Tax=Ciona intestinalis TaxID=7719 RepID=UPI00089DAD30|nr:Golgi resident protein GCP60 [Ciona intestinalis]|eukprot:XP_002130733.2 Golgi resident protein GCP60 [Ciona intestinalis]
MSIITLRCFLVIRMAEVESVTEKLNQVAVVTNGKDDFWGFPLFEAYKMAIKFYKDNEGKRTFEIEYDNKVLLMALTKQVSHGPMNQQSSLPDIGYLDMFGHDRRKVWESLGDISSNDARRAFIEKLESCVPVFGPFMVAHQKEKEEQELKRKQKEDEERKKLEEEEKVKQEEQRKEKELAEKAAEENKLKQDQILQKQQIMQALNAQTHAQFQQYAAQQYPGNPEQQAVLISHLQEQHYQQYMKLYQQQQQQQQQQTQTDSTKGQQEQRQEELESTESEAAGSEGSATPVEDASMWTRPQITEFKEQIKRDPESVLTVGRGEVVTVRVPTHEEGAYVFWEFATDSYDLGFGVYFEWTDSEDQQVSVQIGESSDEETDEELSDPEKGSNSPHRPPTDEVVPIYRRDAHLEVHAGSHRYPGRGVYLLKFDNSYSLWRSKTLYYRVYYTR